MAPTPGLAAATRHSALSEVTAPPSHLAAFPLRHGEKQERVAQSLWETRAASPPLLPSYSLPNPGWEPPGDSSLRAVLQPTNGSATGLREPTDSLGTPQQLWKGVQCP